MDPIKTSTRGALMLLALIRWFALMTLILGFLIRSFGSSPPHFLFPILFGGLSGGGFILILALLSPRVRCPHCDTLLPRIRKPSSLHQACWGGWDCPACRKRTDRKGAKIVSGT